MLNISLVVTVRGSVRNHISFNGSFCLTDSASSGGTGYGTAFTAFLAASFALPPAGNVVMGQLMPFRIYRVSGHDGGGFSRVQVPKTQCTSPKPSLHLVPPIFLEYFRRVES